MLDFGAGLRDAATAFLVATVTKDHADSILPHDGGAASKAPSQPEGTPHQSPCAAGLSGSANGGCRAVPPARMLLKQGVSTLTSEKAREKIIEAGKR